MASAVVVVTMVLSFLSVSACVFVALCATCCKASSGAPSPMAMVLIENPDGSRSIGVTVAE